MASSSGTYKEGGINKQGHNSVSSPYNGGSVHGEWGVPTFQHQQTISMDWTPDEQTLLEEGLAKYATESNIIRYAKIAVQLKNKTVRDVALRCRWMTKKEISKRRKEDFNARKSKDRKEKFIEPSAKPSRLSIQSGPSQAPGMVSNCNDDNIPYNDINGATRQLLQQNAWAFKQISTNLSTHQLHENIGLLSQARDNIFQILTNMNDMGPTMKRMPPLPKMNEELASSILPPTTNFPIQL
ncbi:histone H2A deubiquitinase [Perilla frutescens var. frutescens]|nr:histone H2A deubiquitinase [Perilla frutescens var. frutescens]